MPILYRKEINDGLVADVVVVMCIHQGKDMVDWQIKNLQKFLKCNWILVLHYNNNDPTECIDEKLLPRNVFLTREVIESQRYTSLLLLAFVKCMKFAITHIKSTKIIMLSSGSAFAREVHMKDIPYAAFGGYQLKIDPHIVVSSKGEPFAVSQLGRICSLIDDKSKLWLYPQIDEDRFLKESCLKRGFTVVKPSQCTGSVIPMQVAEWLVEDFDRIPQVIRYACEEVWTSTYVYNWALQNNIEIPLPLCMILIDWRNEYEVKTTHSMIKKIKENEAYGICKLPDDVNHILRKILV